MSNQTDLKRSTEASPGKEISSCKKLNFEKIIDLNSSKFDDFEVIASNKKFLTLIKILLTEVKKEKDEAEKDLDLTDGIVLDTMKSAGEEIISFFQQEHDSLDIVEGAKLAPKTLSKLVTVLTSKKYG